MYNQLPTETGTTVEPRTSWLSIPKGHVNNVLYNRYAESGRVEWALKYGRFIDPENADAWNGLVWPTETGLILRKIVTEFKFVCAAIAVSSLPIANHLAADEISGPHYCLP